MKRLGVLGWPVRHSLSPVIQQAALDTAGLEDWSYQLLPVPPKLFIETVRALPHAGFVGVNVTLPHKERALELADNASFAAGISGAANTLTFHADGTIEAENTDIGALKTLLGKKLANRSVLILGAGGSARAALLAAYWQFPKQIFVWNRNRRRADELVSQLQERLLETRCDAEERQVHLPVPINVLTTEEFKKDQFQVDCIVNCTPVGMSNDDDLFSLLPVQPEHFESVKLVVDFVYRTNRSTKLIEVARSKQIETVDGLQLLLEQAALSFAIWTGKTPAYDAMRHALHVHQSRSKDLLTQETQ